MKPGGARDAPLDRDLIYINGELKLANSPVIPRHQVLDTMKLARRAKLPKPGLDGMIRDLSILVPERGLHSALSDAIILAEAVRLLENPDASPRKLVLPTRSSLHRSVPKQRYRNKRDTTANQPAVRSKSKSESGPDREAQPKQTSASKTKKRPPGNAPWWAKKKLEKSKKTAGSSDTN